MAVRFSGAGTDFYSATTGVPTGNITITCWFYNISNAATGEAIWYIATPALEVGTLNGTTYELYDSGSAAIGPGTTQAINTWHCLAVSINGTSATVYQGTSPSSLSSNTGTVIATTTGNALQIGTDTFSQPFNGRVAAFKMWGAALSATEIAAELTQFQPIRTANLTRYHPFHVAETTDRSGNGNTLTLNGTPTTEADPPIPESGAGVRFLARPPGRISPRGLWTPLLGDTTVVVPAATNAAAEVAAGTGQARDAAVTVGVAAESAAGTGSANAATLTVATSAGVATGTGSALQPSVTTTGNTNASADVATGTGAALAPTVSISVPAGNAAGTGSAGTPTPTVSVAAGNAAGSGAAGNAAGSVAAGAIGASGAGTARNPAMPLTQWRAGLTTSGSTPARWVAVGDSVTEGAYSSTAALRWTRVLLGRLRTAAGLPAGGDGTIPGWVEPRIPAWANSQVTSTGTTVDLGPFGYRDVTLASGQSSTYTITGTKIQIWYKASSGGGSFSYAIDGGGSTTVSTNQGSTAYIATSLIDLGGGGAHTVVISYSSGATVTLAGVQVFDGDTNSGITFYDGGRTDITTVDYVGGGGRDYSLVKPAWDLMAPDLVTIELGLNEAFNAISTSTMTTNLTTLVNDLRALSKPPSIVIVAAYAPAESVLPAATWATYVAAQSSFVAGHPGDITFIDLSALMPQATTSGTGFYNSDGIHPNDAGHAEIARLLQLTLAPPAAPSADQAPLPIRPPGRVSPRGRWTPFLGNVAAVTDATAAGGVATGSGAAQDAAVSITAQGGNAAAAGSANSPTITVGAAAGGASGVGAALDATVTTSAAQARPAPALIYTSRRHPLWDAPTTQIVIAAPLDPDVSASAGVATGVGAANAPTVNTGAAAGSAAGTGAALQPTVSTTGNQNAQAGLASGTGTANQPSATVSPPTGAAAGTGAANTARPNAGPAAGNAAGTGAANQPSVTAPNATAGNAAGTGSAYQPLIVISATAARANGTGAALNPSVTTVAFANATAGVAAGLGQAFNTTNGVPVVLYPISAGVVANLAARNGVGTPTDVTGRDRAGTPTDTTARYRAGVPT